MTCLLFIILKFDKQNALWEYLHIADGDNTVLKMKGNNVSLNAF